MSLERLPFDNPEVTYHSYNSAEHVVRYAALRNLVAGKRVLDVACGEGYGCRLMHDWGARAVVGIEIDQQAVATAQRLFGGDGISFLQGDAEQLETVLADVELFDVIVSFETIEHLGKPEDFLRKLPGLLAEGGLMVISCPNDKAYPGHDNSFHIRPYSFAEFREMAEAHLGVADTWLMGTPILGMLNFTIGDDFVEIPHHDQVSMIKVKTVENAVQIPAQHNVVTTDESCAHYIGVWGGSLPANLALSTLSLPSYLEPWQLIGWLRQRVAELEANQKTGSSESERLQAVIGEFERLSVEWRQAQFESRDSEIARLKSLCDNQAERLATGTVQQMALRERLRSLLLDSSGSQDISDDALAADLDALKAKTRGLIEKTRLPKDEGALEVTRLSIDSRELQFEKEVQILRRRLISEAERAQLVIADLQMQLDESRQLIDDWFVPEIGRLKETVETHEKTKREWWEPQLEARAERIRALEEALAGTEEESNSPGETEPQESGEPERIDRQE
ncbi:methyltransferase domain-containing protein [Rhizobium sp. NFR03]|uniref:class I SAM-dependent methyltransferase n=1 Tax=Rhizobium sp. NFR03 TaxID=1566263 RepID=UPI0008C86F05|nr:methyltransferase domain-containing protein [Rhizobium sp. NFR03]SES27424.1 Methyltransferase domain-containing protein [Rhizobium sp. NFR03]